MSCPRDLGKQRTNLIKFSAAPAKKKKIGAKVYVGQESIHRYRECHEGALQLRYEP
jgi:hypothetical protein